MPIINSDSVAVAESQAAKRPTASDIDETKKIKEKTQSMEEAQNELIQRRLKKKDKKKLMDLVYSALLYGESEIRLLGAGKVSVRIEKEDCEGFKMKPAFENLFVRGELVESSLDKKDRVRSIEVKKLSLSKTAS